jgi:CRISPR-associated protein Cmr4
MSNHYANHWCVAMALDPIHVGTGGSRIGRVDLTIVREPTTQIPKIPGSSLAGVYRTYVAMDTDKYPQCAGLGQARADGSGGHCGQPDCPVCTVFGFARGKDQAGGFAGLASFSDAQVLLFPVPTRQGPHWVTCPMALSLTGQDIKLTSDNKAVYKEKDGSRLNIGWLYLPVKAYLDWTTLVQKLSETSIPDTITKNLALLPDELFSHVVNSNLEVRTSVSINPETGAAEDKALFSYEALPHGTVLIWEVITKSPNHFKVDGKNVSVKINGQNMDTPEKVQDVVKKANPYMEYLGVGGMGTRGMGRLKVLNG